MTNVHQIILSHNFFFFFLKKKIISFSLRKQITQELNAPTTVDLGYNLMVSPIPDPNYSSEHI
jgi:hypothetical protein